MFVFFKLINFVKREKNQPDQYETLSSAHPYSVFHTAGRLVSKRRGQREAGSLRKSQSVRDRGGVSRLL